VIPCTPQKKGVGDVDVKGASILQHIFKIYSRFLSYNLESDLGLSDEGY
jgi:hypothetical protein